VAWTTATIGATGRTTSGNGRHDKHQRQLSADSWRWLWCMI